MIYDAIILGAGASGLFFAATRPKALSVLLLDCQERAGRKILLSGGGKCNFTNRSVTVSDYICSDPKFPGPALKAFPAETMIDFLRGHGLPLEEREHGQMFCKRGAADLRDLLLRLALEKSSRLSLGRKIEQILYRPAPDSLPPDSSPKNGLMAPSRAIPAGANFSVQSGGRIFNSRSLLLATGGKAWPKSGATGIGYKIAAGAGHDIIPPRPALTPLRFPPSWPLHGLQGLSLFARASPHPASKAVPSFTLPLLFTHKGLSGPAGLQISSYLKSGDQLEIDFLPGQSLLAIMDRAEQSGHGKKPLLPFLRALLPERLAAALLRGAGLEALQGIRLAELSRARRRGVDRAIHAHLAAPLPPDFSRAESTLGGVATDKIDPKSMQSRVMPNLYFCGEVLDVCGRLGGYNLHWAWASAHTAAMNLSSWYG